MARVIIVAAFVLLVVGSACADHRPYFAAPGSCRLLRGTDALMNVEPSAPRGGDPVTLSARGVGPGTYSVVLFSHRIFGIDVGTAVVNQTGELHTEFVMPERDPDDCAYFTISPNPRYGWKPESDGFRYVGPALKPAACGALPTVPLDQYDSSNPASLQVRDNELQLQFARPVEDNATLVLRLRYSDPPDQVSLPSSATVGLRPFVVTAKLPMRSDWQGKCISASYVTYDQRDPTWKASLGEAFFDYP